MRELPATRPQRDSLPSMIHNDIVKDLRSEEKDKDRDLRLEEKDMDKDWWVIVFSPVSLASDGREK